MTAGLTPAEFDDAFQRWADSATSTSVFRWEARQDYYVDAEDPSLRSWREGTPRPERSVRTSRWLARIAATTIAGKTWTRVRRIAEPHSEYTAWELVSFSEAQAAGDRVLLTRQTVDLPDFWLFDGAADSDRYAIVMHYDNAGAPVRFEYCDDQRQLARLGDIANQLQAEAEPLNVYLAPRREVPGVA